MPTKTCYLESVPENPPEDELAVGERLAGSSAAPRTPQSLIC